MDIIFIQEDTAEISDNKLLINKLYGFIEELDDEREKNIIIMRYGLYGTEILTQNQIAKKLNISRSYVSRIEKKVIEKLRKKLLD